MQTIRTLIVDDEPRIRRGIERLVLSCGEGWEVAATAGDGREALDYFRATDGAVDLLITDVKMPEMDGLTLIQEAKKSYSFYPLLISGYDDFQYLQTALREGALDYLLKPVDREQFRRRMAEIRQIVSEGRYQLQKRGEMEREAEKHRKARQIQTLSYIASMDIDAASLGYWVDDFPKGRYLLMAVRMDTMPVKARSYKPGDWKAYFYALENIMGEVLEQRFSGQGDRLGWCWRGGETEFWMLLFSPDPGLEWEAEALELATGLRSSIQTYTPFSVSVSYGDPIEDLYLLPEAKRQALGLMNYRFLYGGNRIFRRERTEPETAASGAPDKELAATLRKLKRSVEQGQAEEAEACSKRLFELLDRTGSPDKLQRMARNAMILVHSAGLENLSGYAMSLSLEEELHKAENAASLHELKRCVNGLLERVLKDIGQARESGSRKPIEQAKAWMAEHLDQEITIKRIADMVYMNPTYFSEYFKQQTGETMLDYLTRQRIERAKTLLADQRLKIQEICGRIGYQDAKYFGRLFKQWTGHTPSGYRERLLAREGEMANEQEP
ncbi:response regulator transcription factor [Cohnella hongkongensis]|uniref:Helix-turn-helix domain-containing protein n=1 Tax=Cohnella hongkongensis TaxID=178337 RepID=A0ABV9FFU8_9BACL